MASATLHAQLAIHLGASFSMLSGIAHAGFIQAENDRLRLYNKHCLIHFTYWQGRLMLDGTGKPFRINMLDIL